MLLPNVLNRGVPSVTSPLIRYIPGSLAIIKRSKAVTSF